MKDFHKLNVWHKAHAAVLSVYQATMGYPRDELYGMTSQTRRAAVSVAANIAEGCGRATDADFARFLDLASGSANELEYHLLLAHDLRFLTPDEHKQLTESVREVKQMLASFLKRLRGGTVQPKSQN